MAAADPQLLRRPPDQRSRGRRHQQDKTTKRRGYGYRLAVRRRDEAQHPTIPARRRRSR